MKSRFTITPSAEQDLRDIIGYIAQDNSAAAIKVRDRIYAAFEHLADMPGTGHFREDVLDSRHRFWTVYSYLIVYRWQTNPIQIIAVVQGRETYRRCLAAHSVIHFCAAGGADRSRRCATCFLNFSMKVGVNRMLLPDRRRLMSNASNPASDFSFGFDRFLSMGSLMMGCQAGNAYPGQSQGKACSNRRITLPHAFLT